MREAYKDYMRQVATLLLRDANITIDATETRTRIEQFVSDAYGQEEQLAMVGIQRSRPTRILCLNMCV